MLFIEIPYELLNGLNRITYRSIDEDTWQTMYIDVETLNLLLQNYGVISTAPREIGRRVSVDRPETSRNLKLEYCGAEINLYCGNKSEIYLPLIVQY